MRTSGVDPKQPPALRCQERPLSDALPPPGAFRSSQRYEPAIARPSADIEPGPFVQRINGQPHLVDADNEDGMTGRLRMFRAIADFVEVLNAYIRWYNEKRIQGSLGYLSPSSTVKAWD